MKAQFDWGDAPEWATKFGRITNSSGSVPVYFGGPLGWRQAWRNKDDGEMVTLDGASVDVIAERPPADNITGFAGRSEIPVTPGPTTTLDGFITWFEDTMDQVLRKTGSWISYSGDSVRPVPAETLVRVEYRDGTSSDYGRADSFRWTIENRESDIVAYLPLSSDITRKSAKGGSEDCAKKYTVRFSDIRYPAGAKPFFIASCDCLPPDDYPYEIHWTGRIPGLDEQPARSVFERAGYLHSDLTEEQPDTAPLDTTEGGYECRMRVETAGRQWGHWRPWVACSKKSYDYLLRKPVSKGVHEVGFPSRQFQVRRVVPGVVDNTTPGIAVATAQRPAVPEGYERLADILQRALDQASTGKGKERHAGGLPFHEQPMQQISQLLGSDKGMAFQAIKKLNEGLKMPQITRQLAELYGVINYVAGIAIYLEDRAAEAIVNYEQERDGK